MSSISEYKESSGMEFSASSALSKQGIFSAHLSQSTPLQSAKTSTEILKQEFHEDWRNRNAGKLADAINTLQKIANDPQSSEAHVYILENTELIQKVSKYLKESELLDTEIFYFPEFPLYTPKKSGGGGGGGS